MQFRRQALSDEGVNLTPLIDVVFLLLIFFMVSTTFTKETHLNIDLPEAEVEATVAPLDIVDIVVSSSGQYTINGQSLVNSQVDTLMRALQQITEGQDNPPVVITADAQASHQSVIRVMDVAGRMGLSKLRITTKEPSAE